MIRKMAIGGGVTVALAGALALSLPGHAQAPVDGKQLFEDNCAACHQSDGKGIPGAFPALAGDAYVVGDPSAIAATVINGRGGMPSFKDSLTDAQLSAVTAYVRSSWGNAAAPIPPAVFAAARAGKAAVEAKPLPAH